MISKGNAPAIGAVGGITIDQYRGNPTARPVIRRPTYHYRGAVEIGPVGGGDNRDSRQGVINKINLGHGACLVIAVIYRHKLQGCINTDVNRYHINRARSSRPRAVKGVIDRPIARSKANRGRTVTASGRSRGQPGRGLCVHLEIFSPLDPIKIYIPAVITRPTNRRIIAIG